MSEKKDFVIPNHVPQELIRPYILAPTTSTTGTTFKDPFNELAVQVRNESPDIFYSPNVFSGVPPMWVIWRVADISKIYLDTEHFSNRDMAPYAALSGGTWYQIPAETDPPEHSLFRALIAPQFSPPAMLRLDEKIRLYAREAILKLREAGECEFMKDFAFEFPIKVFMELMGLPQNRTEEFLQWETELIHGTNVDTISAAVRKVVAYLQGEIADRRENPREDLLSFGVQSKVDGRSLTEDELIGFAFNLFIGGLDTVSTHIGLQFLHLATHPQDQAALRAQPELIPDAINEMMRAYPGVSIFRTCIKKYSIKGVTFMPGDKILLNNTVAGRDPEAYDQPDEVQLGRKPRHLSFGFGPHVCIGMHLARREMRIAMEEALRLLPPFHLPKGYQVEHRLTIIQPVKLPLRW